jgi:hypothetical protein
MFDGSKDFLEDDEDEIPTRDCLLFFAAMFAIGFFIGCEWWG